MRLTRRRFLGGLTGYWAAWLLALSYGCAGSVSDADEGATPLGEWCPGDFYCAGSLICADLSHDSWAGPTGAALCTLRCNSDDDCAGLDPAVSYRCGRSRFRSVCLPDPCSGEDQVGVYCDDGEIRTCATEPHCVHCLECAPVGEYDWCDLETGECVPKAALAEPCDWDYQCRSESCSPDERVCVRAAGGP